MGKAVGVGASNRRHPEINAKKYMVFKKRGRRGCEDQRQGKRDGGRKGCEEIWWNNNRNHPPWIVTLG